MPVLSADIWKVLCTISRYLFPVMAASLVFLVLMVFSCSERGGARLHPLM